ncbi:MAG TPA: alkaline phosphatase PafA [Flavobacteriaceae bacterium]|nr:alkaline phosphatase PafA [Flavobacteriaceae bacterium]
MFRFFYIICLCLLFNCQSKLIDNNSSSPKILVGVVVDQMRYDYLTRLSNKFSNDGFNRLINQGFNCTNNHYNYVPTVTGPGHSSIATGSSPSINGIVGNNWYDRNIKEEIYCATDLSYENIGGNAYYGKKSPNNLLTLTFADQNRITNKMKSKTISISIKDRGAIFMGGKNANAAYWFYGKNKGEWITSSYYMNDLPSWVREFNEPENISSFINRWELLHDLKRYDLRREDDNDFEKLFKGKDNSSFPYLTEALMEENDGFDMISETPFGNSMTTDFAIAAIEGEKLGEDDFTDVLTISYSSTDYIGHNFGVFSLETEDTYLRLDLEIKRLLDYLDKKIGKNNYSLFLTADHGALEVPAYLNSKGMKAMSVDKYKFIKSVSKYLAETFGSKRMIEHSVNNNIYINYEVVKSLDLKLDVVKQKIVNHLNTYDFINSAYSLDEIITASKLTNYQELIKKGYYPERSGDIVFVLEPNVIIYGDRGTTHGSGYDYDTHVPLIFYGNGINKGKTSVRTEITDIAPTINELLGIENSSAYSGKILDFVIK